MIPTRRRALIPGGVALLLLLAACGDPRSREYRLSGPTMGTTFSVVVVTHAEFDRDELRDRIEATLDDVNRHMSTYRADSELARLNSAATTDWIPVSHRLCSALDDAIALSEFSDGAFDVTVGALVDLWGFGPGDARFEPPPDEAIVRARIRSGRDKLELDCGQPAIRKGHAELRIDLSGYAKGLAVDEIAALLDAAGMTNYLVEIGGDLRAAGRNADNEKWRIAIERPDPSGRKVERIIRVGELGVATSGDYRNFFEFDGTRFSHTIDPRTGRPVSHKLASVTVLGETAAFADAMATALLVLGPDAGPKFAEREHIAAHFIIRESSEFREKTSANFDFLARE